MQTTVSESTFGMSTMTTVTVSTTPAAGTPIIEMEVLGMTLPASQESRGLLVSTTSGRSGKAYTCFVESSQETITCPNHDTVLAHIQ